MFHEGPSLVAPPCLVLVDICCQKGRGRRDVLLTRASRASRPQGVREFGDLGILLNSQRQKLV